METQEVAFFENRADDNDYGHSHSEDEVSHRHSRCRPERDQEGKHQRMANVTIEERLFEGDGRVFDVAKVEKHMTEAEEIEVIDEKCRIHDVQPPEPEECEEKGMDRTGRRMPEVSR